MEDVWDDAMSRYRAEAEYTFAEPSLNPDQRITLNCFVVEFSPVENQQSIAERAQDQM